MKPHPVQAAASALVFPGVGQLAKKEWVKGFALMFGFPIYVFVAVVITVLTSPWMGVFLGAGLLFLYLWNIYDAYTS